MRSPVILLAGTHGFTSTWWRPESSLACLLRETGCTILGADTDPPDPFQWSTVLDGLDDRDWTWRAAGKALCWYANAKHPPVDGKVRPVSVIAHSHGGAVLAYAAHAGLAIDVAITVATPVRSNMLDPYTSLAASSNRWVHIYSDERQGVGWQILGAFMLRRPFAWLMRRMPDADENVYVEGRSHDNLLDVALWREKGWAGLLL